MSSSERMIGRVLSKLKPAIVSPALSTFASPSTVSFFSAVFRAPTPAPEWHLEDHELHVCRKGVGVGLGLVMGVGGMSGRLGSLVGLGKGKIGDEKDEFAIWYEQIYTIFIFVRPEIAVSV
ncbi:uncharacterized protein ARMOST_07589 [Armillaria ostoyae]|uniref:Uncharacterized protein n=1 Tax=Armillaria ostoyae TaxID=47428 RepID=A0A284R676_ARMOS|nr:uncharacterized protein ARMOST_07589 [Armillaria ostoyae]